MLGDLPAGWVRGGRAGGIRPPVTANMARRARQALPPRAGASDSGEVHAPSARGPLSAAILTLLALDPEDAGTDDAVARATDAADAVDSSGEVVLYDDDLQLALFVLYELHYTGIDGVSDTWEWEPRLIGIRRRLEAVFEATLRAVVPVPDLPAATAASVASALFEFTAPTPGPSLSRELSVHATDEQAREYLMIRSIYQLKEADPHTWAIPRLRGRAKAALVEVQSDEYGGGHADRIHQELYAKAMRAMGLDDRYGAYVDLAPAITLAAHNQMSLFGLNRRLRGAIVGHLAAYEMTSTLPCRMVGDGFRRLGYDGDVTFYWDEHVEADAVHEQIAGRDLAGGLAESEPELLADIMFGAAASMHVDGLAADWIRRSWEEGRSALREPATVGAAS